METTLQEVSSSPLRMMLQIADRRIDRSRNRYEAIEMSNRIRDRFNDYAERHQEVGFELKQKSGYQPLVKVEVLAFDDGMWAYAVEANLPGSGMSGPFSDDIRPSKREAIRAGVGKALKYMLHQERRADGGVIAQEKLKLVMDSEFSVAKANTIIEAGENYRKMKMTENELSRLRSARANVKRRYEILANKALQNFKGRRI